MTPTLGSAPLALALYPTHCCSSENPTGSHTILSRQLYCFGISVQKNPAFVSVHIHIRDTHTITPRKKPTWSRAADDTVVYYLWDTWLITGWYLLVYCTLMQAKVKDMFISSLTLCSLFASFSTSFINELSLYFVCWHHLLIHPIMSTCQQINDWRNAHNVHVFFCFCSIWYDSRVVELSKDQHWSDVTPGGPSSLLSAGVPSSTLRWKLDSNGSSNSS